MRKLLLVIVLIASYFLVACSTNPNAIEPNPLPDYDADYKVKKVWSRKAGKGIKKRFISLRPAVSEGGVYVADLNGKVTAYSADKGKRLWRHNTQDNVTGGLYAGYGVVIYGTREGEAVALSEEDGSELWRQQLSSEILAPPAANASMAVFQVQDDQVYALDIDSGEQLWQFEDQAPTLILRGSAIPVIAGDHVYAAFANGKVVALDGRTGSPLWERRVAEPQGRSELERLVDINNNLIVEGGGVFASSYQGSVSVLDEESGQTYWRKDMSTFDVMDSHLGVLYVADSKGNVWAIDQRSGDSLWRQDLLYGRNLTGVAIQDGQVVVGDKKGYLHWIDGDSGHITARRRHHRKGFASAPVSTGDMLYVYGRKGRLSAYRLIPR